jgi:hypothetical protein
MKWKRSKKAQQEAKAKDEAEKRKPPAASGRTTPMESKVKEAAHGDSDTTGGQQTASSRSVSPAALDSHTTSTVATATNLVLEQNFQPQGTNTRVHHLHHHHLQNHHRRLSLQDGGEALYRPYVV